MKKLFLILITTLLSMSVIAQTHESLHLVVTLPAGTGSGDVIARQWVRKYDEIFGTTSIVVNKPGGDGVIGYKYFSSLKDTPNSIPIMWPAMGHILSYSEPDKEQYEPLIELLRTPWLLIARKDFPANSFKEYVAYAKANPGVVNTGISPGAWGGMIRYINLQNNMSVNFIPYNNTRSDLDVANGTLDTAWVGPNSVIGSGLESKVKVLATTSGTPIKEYPHIENGSNPAIGEWYIYGGPFINANLPAERKEILYKRFEFIRGLPWAQEFGARTHAQIPIHYSGKDYAKDVKSVKDKFDKVSQKKSQK